MFSKDEIVLAGFVGSSFGSDPDQESVTFGGSLSWLYGSLLGAEFLAGFAPNFSLAGGLDDTRVNNYMFNAIVAVPVSENWRWRPFISGGMGALTLHTGNEIEQELGIGGVDETQPGANIGVGLMAFSDRWGFRGDVRHFSEIGSGDPDAETSFLDDVTFWRANAGVAYRW
jgi:hypothetical protein